MPDPTDLLTRLLNLSHQLGREERKLAILGEGNTSARVSADTFLVKASGSSLGTLAPENLTEARFAPLLALLESRAMTDAAVDDQLLVSRVKSAAKKPSVEAMFHAWLLTLPGVNFVGHTHPVAINAVLATKHARAFATKRLCPDEIVCCGAEFVLIPYVDPGLKLALAIRKGVTAFVRRLARPPRIILLENHGVIALGGTPEAVLAATLMAVKAAEIFAGATALGAPRFLSDAVARRIAGRPDEHYREKMLGLR
jgi:rhamnose utilization protein RhaD (predicted bifunctional aldolase and dehydrogenase)